MTILEYIQNSIQKLIEFKEIKELRYGISPWTGAHIIEITKTGELNSEAYLLAEISIVDDFEQLFPTSELIFISENDIISLGEPIISVTNKKLDALINNFDSIKWTPLCKINFTGQLPAQYFNNDRPIGDFQLAA